MKRVLFVDDEPNVLSGFRRMLRNLHREWHMEFVGSGREALDRMTKHPFDVVVSDIQMPEMDGPALLGEIIEQWPETVRIILSGQSDRETIVRSIGFAHQFLAKPCDASTLRSAVMRACSLREQLSNTALRQLVALLNSLPSVPIVYRSILEECRSSEVSARRLGELISQDVAMTTKILQLVNSSFVGLREHVGSPVQATVLLGTETMKALALSAGVFSAFGGNQKIIDALSRHSMNVAHHARRIAEMEVTCAQIRDHAFMAGLLHDVGKLVLLESFPDYANFITQTDGNDATLGQVETETYGATQSEIGGYLLGLWGLPDAIVEAVAFQNIPSKCIHDDFSPLTAIHAAHVLELEAATAGLNTSIVDKDYLVQLGLLDRLDTWRDMCAPYVEREALTRH